MTTMYQLARLLSMTVAYCTLVAILERALTLILRSIASKSLLKATYNPKSPPVSQQDVKVAPPEEFTPLSNFDYRKQEPNKYRPFVTKRHVVMGTLHSIERGCVWK